MALLNLDGPIGGQLSSSLNVSCYPQHSSCPKAACDASCVLSLTAPDDDLPRPPLSLTLVFDLGSFDADFSRWAVEAALNLVDWMGPNDKVGIVAFSSQASEVLQLTPATPSGRESLRAALRSLKPAPPTRECRTPSTPRADPPVPAPVLSAAVNLALGLQEAAQSAANHSSSSRLSSSAPGSSPCSPRGRPPTYMPPLDAAPAAGPSSALSSESSPLIPAAYPSSQASTADAATSPSPHATSSLRRVSDDGTSDSVSSTSSMHALRAGASSPPPVCRSTPLIPTSAASSATLAVSDSLPAAPFSHTAFLHPVPENNGGSDDEFEDAADDTGGDLCADASPRVDLRGPAIHNAAVFLLSPRRVKPCVDPSDDPVTQIRRASACAAPRHHFIPVATAKGARGNAATDPIGAQPPVLSPASATADPAVVHGTEHSFSRVPAHIYNPLADPALDAFDPAGSPRPLSASPFLPIPVYAFGVGGAYDPEPFSSIAAATGGAFQHLPQPRDLPPALAAAFGAASAAFAADVEIRVTPLCGSRVGVVRTGYPLWVEGPDIVIHIPEIAARMQKDVLVTLSLPPCSREEMAATCVKHLAGVATVSYTRARTGRVAVRKSCIVLARIESVEGSRGFGTPDAAAVSEHMRLAAAQACADAVRLCAAGSHGQAHKTLLKLRSGIKQLIEVCKAANQRCADSMRCMHARKVLMHVVADLTAAAAAAASRAAFDSGGHAVLRAIERSHACQVAQAPASVRRCDSVRCPSGSVLRMKSRSAGNAAELAPAAEAATSKAVPSRSPEPPEDLAAAGRCGASQKVGGTAAETASAEGGAAQPEQSTPRGRTVRQTLKMNCMIRRVVNRVRSSRSRPAAGSAAPGAAAVEPRSPPPVATKAPLDAALPALVEPRQSEAGSLRREDPQEVVGVRVSAYTCQAQMALVAAAVRRAER